jgi:hypothetical protein
MEGLNMLQVRPVNKYRVPSYPEKIDVLRDPVLLKTIPERWKHNVHIGMALSSILAFTLSGCSSGKLVPDDSSGITIKNSNQKTEPLVAGVAPIFEHGNGRGSFGCVSVAPPSFLSEEEAFQAIQEEAKLYGIEFDKTGLELKNVGIPETMYYLKPVNEGAGYTNIKLIRPD